MEIVFTEKDLEDLTLDEFNEINTKRLQRKLSWVQVIRDGVGDD